MPLSVRCAPFAVSLCPQPPAAVTMYRCASRGYGLRNVVSYSDVSGQQVEESGFGLFAAAQDALAARHKYENPFNGEESEVERSFLIYL